MRVISDLRLLSYMMWIKVTGNNARDYKNQWNGYWESIKSTGADGDVLWDAPPEQAVEADMERFRNHIDIDLPILDLGCGNGRQTRFLAQHVSKVIGVDISANAIEQARLETSPDSTIDYRVLNVLDRGAVAALHDEIGDMNIYMRAVLHQIQRPDRPAFVSGLSDLLGVRGTLYQLELMAEALGHFRQFPSDSPSGLPKLLHAVVRHGIKPVGFKQSDINTVFPREQWEILDQGDGISFNTILTEGERGQVPASYLIARVRSSDESRRLR